MFIGGLRGSRPCVGRDFELFGGDTTCVLVVGSSGERVVLDAGSGLTSVSHGLAALGGGDVTLLFSHYHLDHMMGLTMSALCHDPAWTFHCLGPTLGQVTVQDAVTNLLGPPYWPLSPDQMAGQFTFDEFPASGLQVGGLHIRACAVSHPGGCLAYRIEDSASGTALVFATDFEWQAQMSAREAGLLNLCSHPKPAALLIMDAHFERAQSESFSGWGHTAWQDDIDIALKTGVSQVLLGHHAPEADDETLSLLETQVQQVMPNAFVARAGQWINVE
ncbi:MAG: MBL fold metallo-hydrolase [Planctomycetes bacterium]|nr:MBL fold metallo-hydrolase [Planctomycetota bacterium]